MASAGGTSTAALKVQIYEACKPFADEDPKHVFNQVFILNLGIIPNDDPAILLGVAQALVNEKLFKLVSAEGLGWRLRSVDEAKRYRGFKPEEEIVYSLIDEAGSEGVWTKTIRTRTSLHDGIFQATIKSLKSKNLISDMKSVEHPTRKMYIKSSLHPSERATGGPWFTDGVLDEPFCEMMSDVVYEYIRKHSLYHSSFGRTRQPNKSKKVSQEEARALRDKSLGPRTKKGDKLDEKAARKEAYDSYLPMPAGYQGYPTVDEITEFVEASPATKTVLTAEDIEHLLKIMCYDNLIEKVFSGPNNVGYKTVKKSLMHEDDTHNVLTEAPCGRCPVFDLCEEGGPVGPSNCEYFSDWLGL